MADGPDAYERVLMTPAHVALVRRSGDYRFDSHADAEAASPGAPMTRKRIETGVGPKGRPMFAERAPPAPLSLSPAPRRREGRSRHARGLHVVRAHSIDDAYHPFGEAGKTVTLSIPRALFERVRTGELGGTGWEGRGGLGIDVVEEVQIDSKVLKEHLAAPDRTKF